MLNTNWPSLKTTIPRTSKIVPVDSPYSNKYRICINKKYSLSINAKYKLAFFFFGLLGNKSSRILSRPWNKICGPKGSQLATLTVYISERIHSR